MERIIELEDADDIISIRSRVDAAFATLTPYLQQKANTDKAKRYRLLLIVSRKNEAMRSLVNMKLLARVIKTRPVELAIVTDHPTIRDHAKEVGLRVFGSQTSAKLARWITSSTPVATPDETLPPIAPSPGEKENEAAHTSPPHSSGETQTDSRKRVQPRKYIVVTGEGGVGFLQQLGAFVLVLLLALGLVLGVVTLLPRATVTLTPVAQRVETELNVRGDPTADSVDFNTLTFPARIDQVELAMSGEIETVDTELAPVGLAEGVVSFINRTEVEQIIPISTTVSTSAGELINFITTQTATIPAGIGAITLTTVIAVEPGPAGNVGAGKINRFVEPSDALLARVVNEDPLTGGTMELAKVVVPADKDRIQAYLRQKIQQEGLLRLQGALGEQEFISPETLQVIVLDVTYDEFAGDLSDTFSAEMQAVVRGTVVGGYNANRLSLAALEAQIPPGFKLDAEGLHFGAGEVLEVKDGSVVFRIFASGVYVQVIDVNEVAEDIAWLPVGEAQALLEQRYALATIPGVELKPDWAIDWIGRLPFSSVQINVVVRDAVTYVANKG